MTPTEVRLRDCFAGTTVLVTGHTGFKGSWLCMVLLELGARVIGIAQPPIRGGAFELMQLADRVESRFVDITDLTRMAAIVHDARPDHVLHLAAQALVPQSYADPVGTIDVNVTGTAVLLQACRSADSVRSILVVTSDKVYRNDGTGRSFHESDPLGGGDPYSASKAMAEMVVECWRDSIGKATADVPPLATARAGNVIGGGDRAPGRIIPDLIDALEGGRPVQLRNPAAVRPWQHVLEPVIGYLMYAGALGQRVALGPPVPDALNFGPPPEAEITVEQLVQLALRRWGSGTWLAAERASIGPEERSLALCSDQARATLGWAPAFTLDQVLDLTVDWYRTAAESPARCPGITLDQIRSGLASNQSELPW